jgi:tripartite-type tricarboxylate transporter receptor subunit TctC
MVFPTREPRFKSSSTRGVRLFGPALLALAVAASTAPDARAQSVADFYKGKTLNIVLPDYPGGSYDNNARMVASTIGKYIPGHPGVNLQYVGTANSIPAANYAYNVAPKDGTVIWAGTRLAPFEPLFGDKNARFDVHKVRWLGSTASETGVVIVWHTAPHHTAADLFTTPLTAGATVPSGDTYLYPNALNQLLHTKFHLITGYPSQAPIALAMQNGEVQGSGNWSWSDIPASHPDWLKDKKIRVLMQLGLTKDPDLPEVPLVMDYARTDEQKQILSVLMGMKQYGYPFFIPPGVPQDRSDALYQAFQATMRDPDFLAQAKVQHREKGMAPGVEVAAAIDRAYEMPSDLVARLRAIVGPQ